MVCLYVVIDMARVCRSKKQQDSQLVAVSISNSKLVSKCEKMFELKVSNLQLICIILSGIYKR